MQTPVRFGMYDPAMERDACGVGFVAHIKGQPSRHIVEDALSLLVRMRHRAATGSDSETGDGAGILLQLPRGFFDAFCSAQGWEVPRGYGVGMVFLPTDAAQREACERVLEETIEAEGQRLIGWRDVPVNPDATGAVARASMPTVRQVFVARRRLVPSAFERKLFIIRKLAGRRIRAEGLDPQGHFHLASFSAETIVYKGMLLPEQLPAFYSDLRDPSLISALALVHSRFSTNTFPSWALAQPLRYIGHNGEINTLQGNRNWMQARRSLLQSAKFEGKLDRLYPIIMPGRSDSAQFDNMLELLVLGGRALPHAMMLMIPEAWEKHAHMSDERQAFYEYESSLMEPWDGPAAIVFTDGHLIGATLDRNGLRPARYLITDDDRVVLASEVGVIDVPPGQVRSKGRLQPGRMFLVDTEEGRIISDADVKGEVAQRWPYRRWLRKNVFELEDCPLGQPALSLQGDELSRQQRAFGYSEEDVEMLLGPMAEAGKEPIGSMGNDTPLAALSAHAPSLFDYFHQRFAQVTNPPIDSLRESMVMSLRTQVGPDGNTFEETPEQCHRLTVRHPVLTNAEVARLRAVDLGVFASFTLSTLYDPSRGPDALERAVEALCAEAEARVDEGHNLLILSDRGVDARRAPIPALLALSAVQQHLVREGTRMQTGLIVETAEAREVHHFALLLGYGAAVVNPYLALDTLTAMAPERFGISPQDAAERYIQAICKGLLKVMSKMGISTLQSYRGAQIFEAVGLDRGLIDAHFTGTVARLEGVNLEALGREVLIRHQRAFATDAHLDPDVLPVGGRYRWRRRGEHHQWNPQTIAHLQAASRSQDAARGAERFAAYERAADGEPASSHTLRAMLAPVPVGEPVPLEEVEAVSAICRRFVTGAMSLGSISPEAHETLAIAMNRIGGRSNSGEGGEEPRRYRPDANGDRRNSAIKQIASGRFGVTTEYLIHAEDLQIKIAQGAKPGEGGQLPGHKVDERIARVRCSTPGVTLISPPPHHDIYSIEDLKQLIYDLKAVNPRARVSVKLVAQAGVGTVAAGVAKAGADAIVVAGWSGGTGASPLSSLKHTGVPWEMGLSEVQQVLVLNDLRGRVRLQADGGMRTSRDVVVAALMGAEEYGFATAALVAEGCVMLRKCHKNTCSVGIATQNPKLRALFDASADDVVRFFHLLAEAIRRRMASLGFRTLDEMIGRVDCLRPAPQLDHWKAQTLDLSPLLAIPEGSQGRARAFVSPWPDVHTKHLDLELLTAARQALEGGAPVHLKRVIRNTDRSVGARLSGEIVRRHGASGLSMGSVTVSFEGSAGQSFGAFLVPGVAFELEGDTNDYLGKGLCGGRLVLRAPAGSRFEPHRNVITGNVALYGATGGEAYISGIAGERFAVRNSGARAVVEGVGDHGCEYMTGGVVVVLGATGRNFAAGMSGGVAFVYDHDQALRSRCNLEQVDLEPVVDGSDLWLLQTLIQDHVRATGSRLGQHLLDHWTLIIARFVKVIPVEYRRVLQQRRAAGLMSGASPAGVPSMTPEGVGAASHAMASVVSLDVASLKTGAPSLGAEPWLETSR